MKGKSSLYDWCNYVYWLMALLIILQTDKFALHLYFNSFCTRIGDYLMPYITHFGDGITLLAMAIVIFLFKSKRLAIFIFIAFLISSGLVQFLKHFIFEYHMRPMFIFQHVKEFHTIDHFDYHMSQSFPSGHATSAFVLFTFLARNFTKSWKGQLLCFMAAFFVAFTRVYLSQHYFEDIFVGSIIGFLCMKYTQVFLQSKFQQLDSPFNFSK